MLRYLWPSRASHRSGFLPVGSGHHIYFEQSGNPDGIPAVYLHGGPGGSTSPSSRRFFRESDYNLVLFDQRGCGKSEPFCSLEDNKTQALIADMEKLRQHLGIDRWLVFGGSWGSTLALAYAQAHPDRVLALVLRGLFLGSDLEIHDFFVRPKAFFPEVWDTFYALIKDEVPNPEDTPNLLEAYWQRLTNKDHAVRLEAARAWSLYEASLVTLKPNPRALTFANEPQLALPIATLEAWYFRNKCFLAPNQLIKNVGKIRHIPAVLVQGRYDLICPSQTTQRLGKAWPELEVVMVSDAGHASMEPGIVSGLILALDQFSVKLSPNAR